MRLHYDVNDDSCDTLALVKETIFLHRRPLHWILNHLLFYQHAEQHSQTLSPFPQPNFAYTCGITLLPNSFTKIVITESLLINWTDWRFCPNYGNSYYIYFAIYNYQSPLTQGVSANYKASNTSECWIQGVPLALDGYSCFTRAMKARLRRFEIQWSKNGILRNSKMFPRPNGGSKGGSPELFKKGCTM